jgi:hypothetical protein
MDAQDIRNLQEAYLEVVMNEDGFKKLPWQRMEKQRDRIYDKYMKSEIDSPEEKKLLKRDKTISDVLNGPRPKPKPKTQREEVDLYDIILSHLLDEGYADSVQSAEKIMVNMSEEWVDSILDESRWGSRGGYREPIGQSDSRRLGRDPRYGSLSDADQAAENKRADSAAEAVKRKLRANLEREAARKKG